MRQRIFTNARGDVLSLIVRPGLDARLTLVLASEAPKVSFYRGYLGWLKDTQRAESDFDALAAYGGFEEIGEKAA